MNNEQYVDARGRVRREREGEREGGRALGVYLDKKLLLISQSLLALLTCPPCRSASSSSQGRPGTERPPTRLTIFQHPSDRRHQTAVELPLLPLLPLLFGIFHPVTLYVRTAITHGSDGDSNRPRLANCAVFSVVY